MGAIRTRAIDEEIEKPADAAFRRKDVFAGRAAPHCRNLVDRLPDADADVLAALVPAAVVAHDLAPHRQHAVLPQIVSETHRGFAARIVAVERERARDQRLERAVVEDHVVRRMALLANHLHHVLGALGQLVLQLPALGLAPARVEPVIGDGQRSSLIVPAPLEAQRHQAAVQRVEVDAAGLDQLQQCRGLDGTLAAARLVAQFAQVARALEGKRGEILRRRVRQPGMLGPEARQRDRRQLVSRGKLRHRRLVDRSLRIGRGDEQGAADDGDEGRHARQRPGPHASTLARGGARWRGPLRADGGAQAAEDGVDHGRRDEGNQQIGRIGSLAGKKELQALDAEGDAQGEDAAATSGRARRVPQPQANADHRVGAGVGEQARERRGLGREVVVIEGQEARLRQLLPRHPQRLELAGEAVEHRQQQQIERQGERQRAPQQVGVASHPLETEPVLQRQSPRHPQPARQHRKALTYARGEQDLRSLDGKAQRDADGESRAHPKASEGQPGQGAERCREGDFCAELDRAANHATAGVGEQPGCPSRLGELRPQLRGREQEVEREQAVGDVGDRIQRRKCLPGVRATPRQSVSEAQQPRSGEQPGGDAERRADGLGDQVVLRNGARRKEQLGELDRDRERNARCRDDDDRKDIAAPAPRSGCQSRHGQKSQWQIQQDVGDPVGAGAHAELQVGDVLERAPSRLERSVLEVERNQAAVDDERRVEQRGKRKPPRERALIRIRQDHLGRHAQARWTGAEFHNSRRCHSGSGFSRESPYHQRHRA